MNRESIFDINEIQKSKFLQQIRAVGSKHITIMDFNP